MEKNKKSKPKEIQSMWQKKLKLFIKLRQNTKENL